MPTVSEHLAPDAGWLRAARQARWLALSEHSERRAQRWVARSFFLLAPYVLYQAIGRLRSATEAEVTVLAIALTSSSIVVMPALGWAKFRLARRLASDATAGEGLQNLLCAGQALAALAAVLGAGRGLVWLDPVAALAIAAVALNEGLMLWRGEDRCCQPSALDRAPDDDRQIAATRRGG